MNLGGELMKSYVLFAHGARDPEWAMPLQQLRSAILNQDPAASVQLAFLEFMTPDLGAAIDMQIAAGFAEIRVVPIFLSQGGHVKRDLPLMIEQARRRHPAVQIILCRVIGEEASVIEAMARSIVDASVC